MDQARNAERPRGRGRVVMLVDNAVNGDSRVQKSARTMAEAGWDVILLGQSPDRRTRSWQLGEAEVRLIPVPARLGRLRHQLRHPGWRRPFAYRTAEMAHQRVQRAKAWRADLRVRGIAERRAFPLSRTTALLAMRWTLFRRRQLNAAVTARKNRDTPLAKARTAFWKLTLRDRFWRRIEPGLWDGELAFGPVVDALAPDLIHANDFRMIGVGARAVQRARAGGRTVKLVWDAHEFLPGLKPRADRHTWMPGHCAHEREYARCADAVVTVSGTLAELLQAEHDLPRLPAVVLNAPGGEPPAGPEAEETPDLRELCGIGPDDPLLVYSGAAAEQRGLGTMVEALPQLPGVHCAFVVSAPRGTYMKSVLARAEELGVAERIHILPYVPYWQVVPFLAAADVGVIPIHHWPNHELALITKFMEYAHARLPVVVSDVRTMAEAVRETGQGEVFRAEDTADFVRAVRAVLEAPDGYRAAYDRAGLLDQWTWQAQAEVLDGVYSGLLPTPAHSGASRLVTA
ncbi:glycosyltransferase family 4 protein [Streptomyces sp. NPDC050738]|uniref:glycosyltransferase family 4 protein n=1 Tax=Streptomyces sp. NPDC050738 TaxID=3154744 RepID=UPI003425C89C